HLEPDRRRAASCQRSGGQLRRRRQRCHPCRTAQAVRPGQAGAAAQPAACLVPATPDRRRYSCAARCRGGARPLPRRCPMSRGLNWLQALAGGQALAGYPASVKVVDGELEGRAARYIAVVPDAESPFPRARNGEVGLLEGWALGQAVEEVIEADRDKADKRVLVAVVDVPSQAYGRREEALGIHQALAGAVDGYARARLAGHPVVALLVGKAMSGAFLAHGYQAQRIIALRDHGAMVHAMGKAAAARITLRSIEELEALAESVPPMAYDIDNYATLGLLWETLSVDNIEQPAAADLARVRDCLRMAVEDIGTSTDLSGR